MYLAVWPSQFLQSTNIKSYLYEKHPKNSTVCMEKKVNLLKINSWIDNMAVRKLSDLLINGLHRSNTLNCKKNVYTYVNCKLAASCWHLMQAFSKLLYLPLTTNHCCQINVWQLWVNFTLHQYSSVIVFNVPRTSKQLRSILAKYTPILNFDYMKQFDWRKTHGR